jgi:hypothetical protein
MTTADTLALCLSSRIYVYLGIARSIEDGTVLFRSKYFSTPGAAIRSAYNYTRHFNLPNHYAAVVSVSCLDIGGA